MDCFVSLKLKIPIRPQRIDVITSFNNTINKQNEGVKHSSYQRFLLKKKKIQICTQ
jgi:hypothetical protein